MKNIHLITIALFAILMFSCNGNTPNYGKKYDVPSSDTYTDYDKERINHYAYFAELADSLVVYSAANDTRNMGRMIVLMNEEQHSASVFSSHKNPKLKNIIETNIAAIHADLDNRNVPREVTYRINFSEVYIKPKDGVVTREGYDSFNSFRLYDISVDNEGYAVRTIKRDRDDVEEKPFTYDGSTIKDLSGEYQFKSFDILKAEPIR
jgi:hypothetical protein